MPEIALRTINVLLQLTKVELRELAREHKVYINQTKKGTIDNLIRAEIHAKVNLKDIEFRLP